VTQSGRPPRAVFKMLEPRDGKLSRVVLRGERGREAPALPGNHNFWVPLKTYDVHIES
jgi:hypothetical protein